MIALHLYLSLDIHTIRFVAFLFAILDVLALALSLSFLFFLSLDLVRTVTFRTPVETVSIEDIV